MQGGLRRGDDGTDRCWWAGDDPEYIAYHDREWGRPVIDDTRLFEKLCLEGFQAGLSWLTILRKRENFRRAFAGFDPAVVATYGPADVERLLGDTGIVRHRGKIESTVKNAGKALDLIAEFGSIGAWVWHFEPQSGPRSPAADTPIPAITPASRALSRELKRRGWTFVGPTTAYAFMQAMGLVNDHLEGCVVQPHVDEARRNLERPVPSLPDADLPSP